MAMLSDSRWKALDTLQDRSVLALYLLDATEACNSNFVHVRGVPDRDGQGSCQLLASLCLGSAPIVPHYDYLSVLWDVRNAVEELMQILHRQITV